MARFASTVALLAVVAVVLAAAAADRKVLYRRARAPAAYQRLDEPVPATTAVSFTLVLKMRNVDLLDAALMEVSDPRSPKYGQHWTRQQLLDTFSAPAEVHDRVGAWLKKTAFAVGHEVEVHNRGDAIKVITTVAVAERLFETRFAFFVYKEHDVTSPVVKFEGVFSVPAFVADVLDMVTGVTELPPAPKKPIIVPYAPKTAARADQGEGKCNTPYTMGKLYNIESNINVKSQLSSQAPYSHDDHTKKTIGFGEDDLANWEVMNDLTSDAITNIIGDRAYLYSPEDSSLAGGEAQLDVQMMVSFAQGANTSFWVESGWMYDYANEIINTTTAPLVNSMSYGWEELNQCDIADCDDLGIPDSQTYVYRTDREFAKIGLLGITMLAASGDNGVEPDRSCSVMYQVYPASSAYVLTVGATTVISSDKYTPIGSDAPPICSNPGCECSTSQDEVAAMHTNNALFDGGGGFSHYNARPSWQADAVAAYLKSGVKFPDQQYWNSTNLGYPDVVALGGNIATSHNGKVSMVAGTSASCPIWASLITILNDDRISAGRPPLGFINPLLYQMWADDKTTFNDIVVGTNGGNHYIGVGACKKFDFYATEGWDAVSGLGSPNFTRIRNYVANLHN